jgi:DNA-binding NarL/FixJ family response regulator
MTIRLLLVDDHMLMRQCLRAMLEGEEGLEVIGEATDGRTAVSLATRLTPDVVVMDIGMNGMNGMEATRQIRANRPGVQVIALSSHADARSVRAMLDVGACGYVLKADAFDHLRTAIEAASRGKAYFCPEVTHAVIGYSTPGSEASKDAAARTLSAREKEVLQLLAEGWTSAAIAKELFLATTTVETHRRNIMRKIKIHRVADLTKFAIREGLTSLDV